MNKIKIENLNFKYRENIIYQNLNLDIVSNSYTTIVGPVGSGKTTLFKLIIDHYESIKINGKINYILTNPNYQITSKTVKKQLMFFLENNHYTKRQITKRVNDIVKEFNLENIIDKDPFLLSEGEKQLVILCSHLVLDLDILLMDNALCRMDLQLKKKIISYFIKLKRKKVTIVNFTSDLNETYLSDYTILLDRKLIINKKTKEVINNNKIFNQNNLKLPFLNDISNKLNYYDLLKKPVNSIEELVDELWK